jgi:hypothetical protein
MYLNIESLKDIEATVASELFLQTDLRIFARYFNLKISVWEPVVESTDIRL